MAATPSIKIVKQSTYKGGTKLWSNRHHFSGGTPPDLTHWTALADAIILDEKGALTTRTSIVAAVCYAAGSDLPLHTISRSVTGTFIESGEAHMPLEVCRLIRYSTDQRTSKNHPIYLFSYMHDALQALSGTDFEAGDSNQTIHYNTIGSNWVSGYSDGTTTYHRAGPNGAVAQDHFVSSELTHRDFPR